MMAATTTAGVGAGASDDDGAAVDDASGDNDAGGHRGEHRTHRDPRAGPTHAMS